MGIDERFKITVYMPTRNRVGLLAEAIASVRRQTYENWELIVVDDASIDETATLLEQLAAEEPRLSFIRNASSVGGAAARNRAILAATGDFVTGLDDDDRFCERRLEAFMGEWERLAGEGERPAFLYSHLNEYVNGRQVGIARKPGSVAYESMFSGNMVGNQIFAPRAHYIESGLFCEALPAWQDLEFFMRVLRKFGQASLVDAATYDFDNTPRKDRISLKKENDLRTAYEMVRSAHQPSDGRLRQMLQLQLFARLYRIRPGRADYVEFLKNGVWIGGLLSMIKAGMMAGRA